WAARRQKKLWPEPRHVRRSYEEFRFHFTGLLRGTEEFALRCALYGSRARRRHRRCCLIDHLRRVHCDRTRQCDKPNRRTSTELIDQPYASDKVFLVDAASCAFHTRCMKRPTASSVTRIIHSGCELLSHREP